MYSTLLTDLSGQIFTVTINRPDKLNALNGAVLEELGHAFDEAMAAPDIRAVILTGAGPKAFVAGADITEFPRLSVEEGARLARRGADLFMRIERAPKPVAAAVNGYALGGGCELAMACHFRLCSDNAQFGQPEINLGLIPGYGGTQRLTKLIGKGRAIELLVTGANITAQQAWQYGLVNHVTAPEELLEKTRKILAAAVAKSPLAVSRCIEAANAADSPEGFEVEAKLFGACFGTEDMREGVAAFLEKRKPVFSGR